MDKIKAAIIGYGNIGQFVLEALEAAPDFEIVGVVRRNPTENNTIKYPVVGSIDDLLPVDVAFLTLPSRIVPDVAPELLEKGINTVDSFDIHTEIVSVRRKFQEAALRGSSVAITAAGWDPGSDSVVRTLMKGIVPKGVTFTNFGPGMSMGHSVAAKAIDGVRDALSVTIPLGTGVHRRMVYVELEDGVSLDTIAQQIKKDDYFSHDETHVFQVPSIDELKDRGHGVLMTRKGVAGKSDNQQLSFEMRIHNPALTAQIMVASARAAMKQQPGAYTLPEIAPIDLLYGDRETLIAELV